MSNRLGLSPIVHRRSRRIKDFCWVRFNAETETVDFTQTVGLIIHTIMDSVACASCVRVLTSYVNFATICEGTEEKINLYCGMQQNEATIKLSKMEAFSIVVSMERESFFSNLECSFNGSFVKEEVELTDSSERCKLEKSEMCQNHTDYRENLKKPAKFSCLNVECVNIEQYTNIGSKSTCWFTRIFQKSKFLSAKCKFQTKNTKRYLKSHLLVHKNISEVQMFRCDMCKFQTQKHKAGLKKHLLIHKKISELKNDYM
ncbi:hypothetical protein NQ317_001383 [Molorchus minor]|uniref:C2H2-type domain-containing protein n=1 Tax=Molorchus minor TaxID=1323400 RepID=A0ABQ9J7S4_9CUCU|nr:hypothetical protein NQ317_001383 [Molorchus minor]